MAYDPCYHQACDNLGNVDRAVFEHNLGAAGWTVGIYAYSTEEIDGVPPRAERAALRAVKESARSLAGFSDLSAA